VSTRSPLRPTRLAPFIGGATQRLRVLLGLLPASGQAMYGSRRQMVMVLAAGVAIASCDHHPMIPAVATRPGVTLSQTSGVTSALALDGQLDMDQVAKHHWADQPVPLRAVVDDFPAWSPDGRLIAFHRRFPSSYGPAGLYVVRRHGGKPRFLLPGGFFFPREVSFSPDGERLVCSDGNRLAFVDLRTGAVSRPLYTDNGTAGPDWSPDGGSVVYGRVFRSASEPPDSSGLHLFDVESGLDRPLKYGGQVLFSGPVQWIRNGTAIAFIHGNSAGDQFLSVASLDGTEFSPLFSVPFGKLLWSLQHVGPARLSARALTTESLVMLVIGRTIEKTLQVTIDPFTVSERPLLGLWDALSPTGSEVVAVRPDPSDSLGVLYVERLDAPPQVKVTQLTRFDPP